jgi:hypothetical protein
MFSKIRNLTVNRNRYREHSEAVIISCYFNPQKSQYRTKAFNTFYDSIKHLNHLIVECVIGDAEPELKSSKNVYHVYTKNLLWHKEALLNLAVTKLPAKYKYVFWVDADVIFTNLNWLVDSVQEFKSGAKILQPFEYCVHLEQDELEPSFDVKQEIENIRIISREYSDSRFRMVKSKANPRHPKLWRSFCANFVDDTCSHTSNDYNTHGHVGFAWGATREVLEKVPLYDKALIGGAYHIIGHSAAGQIPHPCIDKSFTDDLDNVYKWSKEFYNVVNGEIAYTYGNLYHIWHGDIEKRQYLKRIQEFTPETKQIVDKDSNGLYVTKKGDSPYIKEYFEKREVKPPIPPGGSAKGPAKHQNIHYHNYGSHGYNNTLLLPVIYNNNYESHPNQENKTNASENFS